MSPRIDLDALARDYEREAPIFERLRLALEPAIHACLLDAGFAHTIGSRKKDYASLARKAVKKGWSDAIHRSPDLAGIRVVVAFSRMKDSIVRALEQRFDVADDDDKVAAYGTSEFRYLGRHMQIRFRAGTEPHPSVAGKWAELQLHTRAESAWADASHDLTYKSALELPDPLQRRVNRLLALVELFDGEMGRAQDELIALPGFPVAHMLQTLERAFLPLARRDFDRELSTLVLSAILNAYTSAELEDFERLVTAFVAARATELQRLYARWGADPYAHPLVLQPEAIAVFDRLERNTPAVRDAWDRALPAELLDSLAALWGLVISRPGDPD